jgi:hypothetical protein
MRVCEAGATTGQVITEVTRRWPTVPVSVVSATVLGLVRNGFLLTDLLPGDLTDDPLGHLLGRLPAASPAREKLTPLRRLLADADRYRPGDPARLVELSAARELADEISFAVLAATRQDLAAGRLQLAVSPRGRRRRIDPGPVHRPAPRHSVRSCPR